MLVLAMDCSRAIEVLRYLIPIRISGGHSDRVTPVPIPNTEVKPVSADGTWGETPRESRASPDLFLENPIVAFSGNGVFRALFSVNQKYLSAQNTDITVKRPPW